MSNNNNGESKDDAAEGKRGKNTPKRRKFRSFSLGKYIVKKIMRHYFLSKFDSSLKFRFCFFLIWNIFFKAHWFLWISQEAVKSSWWEITDNECDVRFWFYKEAKQLFEKPNLKLLDIVIERVMNFTLGNAYDTKSDSITIDLVSVFSYLIIARMILSLLMGYYTCNLNYNLVYDNRVVTYSLQTGKC